MTVGTSTYKGIGVPLNGEVEMKQDTAATDFVTLTGDSSISGDLLVMRAGATEVAWFDSAGKLHATGIDAIEGLTIAAGKYLKFSTPISTGVPTTGITKGQMFLVMKSSTPQLGVAVNAATTAQSIMYFTANTATFGRASTT